MVIMGSESQELIAACKMMHRATIGQALEMAKEELGLTCKALVISHALLTLPINLI